MDIQNASQSGMDKKNRNNDEMRDVMQSIMTGECTDAQIAGFLVGLRSKGETVNEITAAAHVRRELANHIHNNHENLIDTCGKGGDGHRYIPYLYHRSFCRCRGRRLCSKTW